MTGRRAWVGIDPGGTWTGIVTRRGDDLIAWDVLHRDHDERPAGSRTIPNGPGYLCAVVAVIRAHLRSWAEVCPDDPDPGIAVEDLSRPTGFAGGKKHTIDPEPLMAAAATWGAVMLSYPDAVRVAPGGNGARLLALYPPDLVTAQERRHGLNRSGLHGSAVSHARSAWDVAGAGLAAHRVQSAARATRPGA